MRIYESFHGDDKINNFYSFVNSLDENLFGMSERNKISKEINELCLAELNRILSDKGISRRRLSLLLNYSVTTAQQWFRNKRWPYRDEERICKVLKLDPDRFRKIRKENLEEEQKQEDSGKQRLINLIESEEVDPRLIDSWLYQAELDRNLKKLPSKKLPRTS